MQIQYGEIDNGIVLIKLAGSLDIVGIAEIGPKFIGCCSREKTHVVVDLSAVDFLASSGIRLLTSTAKSIASRGGKMVILSPIPEVLDLLDVTGIPAIIPIYSHIESAETILLAR